MEKYAVDLDKVLDELEFNEDRAEQLASTVNKRTANGTTQHVGYGPAARKSSAPSMHYRRPAFEPINLADADFAAAPQPSASYIENSYTPQAAAYHENRHSGSHWQQNGVTNPHVGSMFSSLSEFVGDGKNELKNNHSPTLWIQKNLAESRNINKAKSEKRNGSLDVFISNVTLNSGGHVSECDTSDGLYYNEFNKSGETIDITHKQNVKIKRNSMDGGILGSRIYGEYLPKNITKNDVASGASSIICEPFSAITDGHRCQTSESSVMGVDISCEAEGLDCNSSNPSKEHSSDNCSGVAENNTLVDEGLEYQKISCDGNNKRGDSQTTQSEEKLSTNTDKATAKEQMESRADETVSSGCDTLMGIHATDNVPENSNEAQYTVEAITPVIGFTSFADISDEELQQYLQELEEEVGNEVESLATNNISMQECIKSDNLVNGVCVSTTNLEKHNVPKLDRREHFECVDECSDKVPSDDRNIPRTAKVQECISEVTKSSDSSQTVISDVNIMPVDTGPPSSMLLAKVPELTSSFSITLPSQVPSVLQESIITVASQDSASTLAASTLSLSGTTSLTVLPGDMCDLSHNGISSNDETTQLVQDFEDNNVAPHMNNVPVDVASSKYVSVGIASIKSVSMENPPYNPTSSDIATLASMSPNVAPSKFGMGDVASLKSFSTDVPSKLLSADFVSSESCLANHSSSKPVSANFAPSKTLPADLGPSVPVPADVDASIYVPADVDPSKSLPTDVDSPKSVPADVSINVTPSVSSDAVPSTFVSIDALSKSVLSIAAISKSPSADVASSKSLLANVAPSKSVSADVIALSESLSHDGIPSKSVVTDIASSKSMSVVNPVSANSDVSAALIQYVSSNTDATPAAEAPPASCSDATYPDSQLPQSAVTVPKSSDMCTASNLPAVSVSSLPKAVADNSAIGLCVPIMNKQSSSTVDTNVPCLQHGQEIRSRKCSPPQNDSCSKKPCDSEKIERTLNDSTAELLLEAVAASPPSYQSVIDASNYECVGGKDSYVSHQNNPVPRSEVNACSLKTPEDSSSIDVLGEEERPSRPHFLHLPSKINLDDQNVDPSVLESPSGMLAYGPPGETPSANPHLSMSDNLGSEGTVSSPDLSDTSSVEQVPSDSLSDMVSPEDRTLGKLPPYWVPDGDAPSCMLCDLRFTVLKRRHHCRACGKVLCSKCCNLKSRLEYLENAEARVCQPCFEVLARVCAVEQCESASGSPSSVREASSGISSTLGRRPNPNNPMEYCSTIPPMEQAASTLRQPPPSVLVPVGVLKREGSARSKSDVAKQVMFSDGIRPGGDLTELDGSTEPRMPYRRPGRVLKRVGTPPGGVPVTSQNHSNHPPLDPKTNSFIPETGLPPIVTLLNGDVRYEDDYESDEKLMVAVKSETELPVVFAINRNLFVQVKILNLDCCVNRTCWCFSTLGLRCVGQDEVLIVLECQQGEATVPRDIFLHLNSLYQEASRGVTVGEMGYSVVQRSNFLGSLDHGGFIYVRPTFQCLQKLVLPPAPYLVAILIHRWETPWARLFPIRLMLRLGAEFRYYPCMLVSIRQRKPVYCEIGHTIMNLLADFRNLSYTLPSVRGLVIHMEDSQTSILLPKNRYDQVMRALNNSNDHVLAFAANFSQQADSHLVCIQGTEDESYHTQAINIHTKPRKVTGASFVVFNGALKSSLNLTAKSSIVEDGLMVQITADDMVALRTALRNMADFTIGCGPSGAPAPDELILIKWVADDKDFNVGVRSCIDGMSLDGVPSIRVHNGTDYVGPLRFIRWTEVFIIQSEDGSGQSGDPLDISKLSESIAQATCMALIQLLDSLAEAGLTMLAVRANIHPDSVGYEAGSGGEKLAPVYMNSLDNELVPVLHKAASSASESPAAVLELVFHIMLL